MLKGTSGLHHLLQQALQVSEELFRLEMDGASITPRQYAVLNAVHKRSGLNQGEIGASTSMDPATVADVVKRLVRNGLLARRRTAKDQRAYSVFLTPEGAQLLSQVRPRADTANKNFLKLVDPARRKEFVSTLNRVAELRAR